jgi:ferric enterobactin receptor|nr:TonB-dependent receptor [uncultured Neisseria sp.]
MPFQTARPCQLSLSLLTLALFGGFAHAADTTAQTSELQPVTVKGANLSTHRVTTQKIAESTDIDLKGLLFNEPSIGFGGGNGTSQWVNIRGLGQDQIDFKVDDAYADTSTFHHQSRFLLDPELVKVVAVQKGSGSASAGIGASSGAIVAETIDPSDLLRPDQNFGFKVNAGVSSNKGWNRGLSLYGRAAGFDALVAGNWIAEENYKAGKGYVNGGVSGGNRVPFSALGQRGLLAKIGYSINEDNRIELSRSQEQTHGTRTLREEFDDFARNPASYRTYTQDRTNLEYKGANLGFVSNIKANAFHLKTVRKDGDNPAPENKAAGANINLDSRIFDRHTLKYGVNYRTQKNHPALTTQAAKESKTDYGVYLEGIWDFQPVTLTTGLRYDHFKVNTSGHTSASDGNINPSLGLIYDVTDNLSLKASHSYATRSPRLYESMLASSRNIVTAPNLKAERSRTTEIGFNYRPIQDLSLTGSYFWQKINNVHDFTCLSGSCTGGRSTYTSGITQSTNNGYIKNKGYEFGANYRWRGLTARMGVAYSDPKHHYLFESYDINTKAHAVGRTWTAGLAYRFDRPNLEIGWRGRFVQSRIGKPSRGATASEGTTEKRAGYGVNDIYANWKPTGKDDLNVNFAVNNVGNKYYYSHSQRSSSRNGNSLPEVGRDFRLAVNYKF